MTTQDSEQVKGHLQSRRRFLGQASCAAVTAAPLLSTLLNLKMTGTAAAAEGDDYKALICVFMAGGNDSFNMLVPASSSEYAGYQAARSNLALPRENLLPLDGTTDGRSFGLHPGMPEVQSLYNSGRLAFVSNVGTLVEPITLFDFKSNTTRLPLGLFSHADQIMHWQTSIPDQRTPHGWGGRVADIVAGENANSKISMNISLSGTNTFQSGSKTVSYEIESQGNGSITLADYDSNPALTALGNTAVNSLMDAEYKNLFQKTFAASNRSAIDASEEFASAVGGVTVKTAFSPSGLSQSLQMIARTIGARNALGMKRQTFFVLFGGWDHHGELLNTHGSMVPVVSKAMSEFDTALTEIGMNNNVTTFTASDFARTLSSNGRGSDHAWGGNQMVMGGAVKGGKIYGQYPDLAPDNALDTGRGRLIPTTSTDEYFAELAQWFGVPPRDLSAVFPNLDRFYSPGTTGPVGFLS